MIWFHHCARYDVMKCKWWILFQFNFNMILSKTQLHAKCYRLSPYSIANLHFLMNLCVYLSTVYILDDYIGDFTRKISNNSRRCVSIAYLSLLVLLGPVCNCNKIPCCILFMASQTSWITADRTKCIAICSKLPKRRTTSCLLKENIYFHNCSEKL